MKVLFVGARGNGKSKILNDLMDVYGDNFAYLDVADYKNHLDEETDEIAEKILNDAKNLEKIKFGVFIGGEFQNKAIRDKYLTSNDLQIIVEKYTFNDKTEKGLNNNFNPNYDGIKIHANIDRFNVETFIEYFFRKIFIDCIDDKKIDEIIKTACQISPNVYIEDCNLENLNEEEFNKFKEKFPFIKLNSFEKNTLDFFSFYDIVITNEEINQNKYSNDIKRLINQTKFIKF